MRQLTILTRDGASATGSSTHEKAASTVSLSGPLRELLAIDQRQTLEFFVLRLQDISDPTVDRQELLYNASVLAHYAHVSTQPSYFYGHSGVSRASSRHTGGKWRYQRLTQIRDTVLPVYLYDRAVAFCRAVA